MSRRESRPALGSRENFWGGMDEGYDTREISSDEPDTTPRSPHMETANAGKMDAIAREIVRHEARQVCPECWHERGAESVLSKPSEWAPVTVDGPHGPIELHVCRFKKRVCPRCSRILGGGLVLDRPTDEFRELVEYTLRAVGPFPERRHSRLLEAAMRRKQHGDFRDVDIVRALLVEIRHGADTV